MTNATIVSSDTYSPAATGEDELKNLAAQYLNYSEQLEALKAKVDSLKAKMVESIGQGNVYQYNDKRFTVVAETTSKRFDTTNFKKQNKELYESYLVESKRAAYLKVTNKK